jgi:hypothetical protein
VSYTRHTMPPQHMHERDRGQPAQGNQQLPPLRLPASKSMNDGRSRSDAGPTPPNGPHVDHHVLTHCHQPVVQVDGWVAVARLQPELLAHQRHPAGALPHPRGVNMPCNILWHSVIVFCSSSTPFRTFGFSNICTGKGYFAVRHPNNASNGYLSHPTQALGEEMVRSALKTFKANSPVGADDYGQPGCSTGRHMLHRRSQCQNEHRTSRHRRMPCSSPPFWYSTSTALVRSAITSGGPESKLTAWHQTDKQTAQCATLWTSIDRTRIATLKWEGLCFPWTKSHVVVDAVPPLRPCSRPNILP